MKKLNHQKIGRMNRWLSILCLFPLMLLVACNADQKKQSNKADHDDEIAPEYIIQKAIENSGKAKVFDHKISYKFRDKTYISEGNCGQFKMIRIDSSKQIKDVYYKNELKRTVDGKAVQLPDSTATRIKSSINSVNYFVHLPYRLEDAAVQAQRLLNDTIDGKAYYQLEVKFKEKGGGKDFQDVYRYWFDQNNYSMDYLAYTFLDNGGGMRFRAKRFEKRNNDVVFQDYNNFKPTSDTLQIDRLSTAYQKNQLKKVSEIIIKSVSVNPTNQSCD